MKEDEISGLAMKRIRSTTHLLLNGKLDLQSLGMRLRPDESSINKAHFVEALQLLETNREELPRFRFCNLP